jgi:hypothetical protein
MEYAYLWAGLVGVGIVIGAVMFHRYKRISFDDYRKKYDDL